MMDMLAGQVGSVMVSTTSGRGHTPAEVAARCADRIMYVSDSAPDAIRRQALEYKAQIQKVLELYMREAIASDRTTVYNALVDAGHPGLADLIRKL